MEVNENVRKMDSKRKKVIITTIICIAATIGLILLIIIPKPDKIYKGEISDGFLCQYKLVVPIDLEEKPYLGSSLYFSANLSLDELKSAYEKEGYVVEECLDYKKKRCLVISLYTEKGLTKIWKIGKGESRYYQGYLSSHIDQNCYFPYPTYFNDSATFQDYVDFYNSSLTEIVKVDNENQTIVINAIDRDIGDTFNALVEIRYTTIDGKVKIETNRIYNVK